MREKSVAVKGKDTKSVDTYRWGGGLSLLQLELGSQHGKKPKILKHGQKTGKTNQKIS